MASVKRRSWWWTWLQVPGVGIGRLKQLEQAFGSLQAAWWAPAEQLLAVPGVGPSLLAGRDQLQRNGSALPLPVPAKVLLPADAAMPAALKALPQPPASTPLLSALGSGASFEALQLRMQLSAGALAQQLLLHEQQGSVEALPGLFWRPRHTDADLPVAQQP